MQKIKAGPVKKKMTAMSGALRRWFAILGGLWHAQNEPNRWSRQTRGGQRTPKPAKCRGNRTTCLRHGAGAPGRGPPNALAAFLDLDENAKKKSLTNM